MISMTYTELQQENEELKARLYPFLKKEFEERRVHEIAALLYPKTPRYGQPQPEFRDPGFSCEYCDVYSWGEDPREELGTIDLNINYWCGDYTDHHTVNIPAAWMNFDNQVEDLRSAVKQWCEETKIRLEETKRQKDIESKAAHIKRLEDELKKAKGEE